MSLPDGGEAKGGGNALPEEEGIGFPRQVIRHSQSALCGGTGDIRLSCRMITWEVAGEPGFEPRSTESESAVLPLNYSPA